MSNTSYLRKSIVTKHPKTYQLLSIVFIMFALQACTCFGIQFDEYFLMLNSGPSQQETSQDNVLPPSSPDMICDNLRLTSPLGGLPNGSTTFYWDALPGAISYQINIFGENNAFLAGFNAGGDQSNLTADVSWNAIGGQFILQVELVALSANGQECSRAYTISREAPVDNNNGGERPRTQPTSTPLPL